MLFLKDIMTQICQIAETSSDINFLTKNILYVQYTTINWISLVLSLACSIGYIYAALQIYQTNKNRFNQEFIIMSVGLFLNILFLLDSFIFCSDFTIMISQATQQLLILVFCWKFTQAVNTIEDNYSKKLIDAGKLKLELVPMEKTKFYRYFVLPSIFASLILLISAVVVSLVVLATHSFSNAASISWILNLTLNCFVSFVLVTCIIKSNKRINEFQNRLLLTYGKNAVWETDFLFVRRRQLNTLVIIFAVLTVIDLLLIIFASIIESEESKVVLCFDGCVAPIANRGASYLSVKLFYNLLTP
jgi:hypothetical protein